MKKTPSYQEFCEQNGFAQNSLKARRIYQSEINPVEMSGVVVFNTHFVNEKGNPYEIESVEGFAPDGTEAIFYSWKFPENFHVLAQHTVSGKVRIL